MDKFLKLKINLITFFILLSLFLNNIDKIKKILFNKFKF